MSEQEWVRVDMDKMQAVIAGLPDRMRFKSMKEANEFAAVAFAGCEIEDE